MFKEQWDRQIKVYVYFSQKIARDIFAKTMLKVQICEKIQNQRYVTDFLDRNFYILILSINATWKNIVALKNVSPSINHK